MDKHDYENLQPLRIPGGGWTVEYNKFENIEPGELSEQDEIWHYAFTEDILLIQNTLKYKRNGKIAYQKLSLDLGWYPDGEPNGEFRLVAILNDNWENPLLQFKSRRKDSIAKMIEQWLFQEFMPLRFIEESIFRKNHIMNGLH